MQKFRFGLLNIRLLSSDKFILGPPTWSVKEMNHLSLHANIVTEDRILHLAKLAAIDLSSIPCDNKSDIMKEICNDVNVVLKCAESLKVRYSSYVTAYCM